MVLDQAGRPGLLLSVPLHGENRQAPTKAAWGHAGCWDLGLCSKVPQESRYAWSSAWGPTKGCENVQHLPQSSQSVSNVQYKTTQPHKQHCLRNLLRSETGYKPPLHVPVLHRDALGTHQDQAGAFRWCVVADWGLDGGPKRCPIKGEEWYFLTDPKLWGDVEGRRPDPSACRVTLTPWRNDIYNTEVEHVWTWRGY